VVGTDDQGTLISDRYDPVSKNWQRTHLGWGYGIFKPPLVDDAAGTATIAAVKSPGTVDLITLRAGRWEVTTSLPGGVRGRPALVQRANGTFAVYALAAAGDDVSHLYVREQLPNGDFLAWRRFGDPTADYETVSAIARGDQTTVLATVWARDPQIFRHALGAAPASAGELSGTGYTGELTIVQDGRGDFLVVGALRTGEGIRVVHVRRENADGTGFENTWQSLGTFGTRNAWDEPVVAQLLPNGSMALSVPADGEPWVTTSKGTGSTEFLPWASVDVPKEFWFANPTALSMSRTGEVLLTAGSQGNRRHLFSVSVPADRFIGGPLYPY
jgi:hypothetical protein